jgi:hypothetical protein
MVTGGGERERKCEGMRELKKEMRKCPSSLFGDHRGPDVYVVLGMTGEVRVVELEVGEEGGERAAGGRKRGSSGARGVGKTRGGGVMSFALNITTNFLHHCRERGVVATGAAIVAVLVVMRLI